jgi:hypothetical protein
MATRKDMLSPEWREAFDDSWKKRGLDVPRALKQFNPEDDGYVISIQAARWVMHNLPDDDLNRLVRAANARSMRLDVYIREVLDEAIRRDRAGTPLARSAGAAYSSRSSAGLVHSFYSKGNWRDDK